MSLSTVYNPENKYEIGVDEAGRGPLFGRLYVAAVILPDGGFNHPGIKDSKKIKSKKKMIELSELIKKEAKMWAIHYIDHDVIDKINIRQAVFQGMHECIKQCLTKDGNQVIDVFTEKTFLLIDGNDFKPFSVFKDDRLMTVPYETIEGGDNRFQAIAAASILDCSGQVKIFDVASSGVSTPKSAGRYFNRIINSSVFGSKFY